MSNIVYYFSATGNSLNVAKNIANELKNTKIESIADLMKDNTEIKVEDFERVGFVLPVYAWGMPRIVTEFIESIDYIKAEYVFAIATCGGTPGKTLIEFDKLLNKKKCQLNAGFTVKEGAYTFLNENLFMKIIPKVAGGQPDSFLNRKDYLMNIIRQKEDHEVESSSFLANGLGNLLHSFAIDNFKSMDEDFWINENCSQCNVCADICPRDNIKTKDGQKIWQNNCEFCFACIQWCPNKALEYSDESINEIRAHNENIRLEELL